ncbi:dTDP-4-dehydrorhamnose 3,5-epimerase [Polaribacter aquimarinus]|uniref:dTDP-4-dehydrorhamnose 3,5-epimerase n=3 Tax=Polaribacter TaxID=52959 RepID=A0A2U2JBC2_9FLAO|nr:dTDP-4-dehydrorhamnose 3,5-epimerase [Polaribacter aquimarinus]PWG05605.1 dTDP-4-dehydrorhamnose 3,5-epimerase [Polaribacter aquimarinus]
MLIKKTSLEGCYLLQPKKIEDHRGAFILNFNKKEFEEAIKQKVDFVLENESISNYGVVRGLHMQKGQFSQAKLVRVVHGAILDVVVDARIDSPTFGETFSQILSAENNYQLFIPRGFLHGFSVLQDKTKVNYKCDNYYFPAAEDGVVFNDSDLKIDWKIVENDVILSEKDKKLPSFKDFNFQIK